MYVYVCGREREGERVCAIGNKYFKNKRGRIANKELIIHIMLDWGLMKYRETPRIT